jgi:polygalacturonase
MQKILYSIFLICSFSNGYSQFDVVQFGAIPDAKTLNTQAIQQAIDNCAKKGGTVIIPKGMFLTGTIFLKSNVELEIREGGVLLGSDKREHYQKNDWFALILAKGLKNVRITGKGTIDGQGAALAADVERMRQAGLIKNVKPYNRPDEVHRPQIIEMNDCHNVHVEGITIKNAACWVQTYLYCTDMVFKNMRVESTAFWNNDGLDLVDCKNVLIKNCYINSADDAICLKSYGTNRLCENIKIKRCTLRSSASAFKLGTASYGGFKHIRVKNLYIFDTYRSAVALESVDGGIIEDIKIKNIRGKNIGNAIFIRLGKRNQSRPVGRIENIVIKNLKATIPKEKPDKGYPIEGPPADSISNLLPSSIVGLPNHRIKNVLLKNIKIHHAGGGSKDIRCILPNELHKIPEHAAEYPEFSMFGELPAWGFFLRHTEGVRFKRLKLTLEEKDYRPDIVKEDSH